MSHFPSCMRQVAYAEPIDVCIYIYITYCIYTHTHAQRLGFAPALQRRGFPFPNVVATLHSIGKINKGFLLGAQQVLLQSTQRYGDDLVITVNAFLLGPVGGIVQGLFDVFF